MFQEWRTDEIFKDKGGAKILMVARIVFTNVKNVEIKFLKNFNR